MVSASSWPRPSSHKHDTALHVGVLGPGLAARLFANTLIDTTSSCLKIANNKSKCKHSHSKSQTEIVADSIGFGWDSTTFLLPNILFLCVIFTYKCVRINILLLQSVCCSNFPCFKRSDALWSVVLVLLMLVQVLP